MVELKGDDEDDYTAITAQDQEQGDQGSDADDEWGYVFADE